MKPATISRIPVFVGLITIGFAGYFALRALESALKVNDLESHPVLPKVGAYPTARLDAQTDTLHGTLVADPYRWLEDSASAETEKWVAAENAITQAYLRELPHRSWIRERVEQLVRYERWSPPVEVGGRWWFSYDDGVKNQPVLQMASIPDSTATTVLDPNLWSDKGTSALAGSVPDPTGRWLAYGVAENGSDWNVWRVRDLVSGKDLDDRLQWIKFSTASWAKDGSGFYYSRYAEPDAMGVFDSANKNQKVYFHRVGTTQSEDTLVHARSDKPDWGFIPQVTHDGKWLVLEVWEGASGHQALWVKDLTQANSDVVPLADNLSAAHAYVTHDDNRFVVFTTEGAERGRVVEITLGKTRAGAWKSLVPEIDATLEGASCIAGKLVLRWLRDAHHEVAIANLENGAIERKLKLPQSIGSVAGFQGKREDINTYFSFTNMVTPSSTYRLDIATGVTSLWKAPKVPFDPTKFETKQVFVISKDGTKVPMFMAAQRDAWKGATRPTLLYGYGGFNVSLTPEFSASRLAWMEMGGVFAMACLRGGGEYGEAWHVAGSGTRKQNVFDDFIACAEWLIKEQITTTPQLAIQGESNGGLLVGACLTQRPELFGCALPGVGVMDMLRFHKFTIGWAWISDYGNPDKAEDFAALRAYSPLHNLKPNTNYPPTLITTANTDDRVVPAHSFKFAAALQAAQAGSAPCLIRIEMDAGHGAGKPMSKILDEAADRLAFVAAHTGI